LLVARTGAQSARRFQGAPAMTAESEVFRLEAINRDADEWREIYPGPVWVLAISPEEARNKVADHIGTVRHPTKRYEPLPRFRSSWQNPEASTCKADPKRQIVRGFSVVMSDDRPMPEKGQPAQWRMVTVRGDDKELAKILDEEYRRPHEGDAVIYRAGNNVENIVYYLSPEAVYDANRRAALPNEQLTKAGIPDVQELRAKGFSRTAP
jgi:hypothetical protein